MFRRRYVQTTLCSEDVMFRRRNVQKTLCLEDVMFRRRYVQKTLCSKDVMFPILNYFNLGQAINHVSNSALIISSHIRIDFRNSLFPSCFPTEELQVRPSPHACHMPRPSQSLWLRDPNTCLRAIHDALFSSFLLIFPFYTLVSSSGPCFRAPCTYILLLTSEAKFHTHTKDTKLYFLIF